MSNALFLVISRDKNCFGKYRAVEETFCKNAYRLRGGRVEVKHAGKWVAVEERDASATNYRRETLADMGAYFAEQGVAAEVVRTYAAETLTA